ncbi:hypothetical protein PanWU01x14_057200 [Parasponia andersonii]|uniref:Uncharacterized protein n=1 Tax=Parasponia andersonii TaxID=3476 RepID=A0A2P5DJS9_PARAD|nr:hypothetical protein PanWU01x14_057200 [Parasponia andersonii]
MQEPYIIPRSSLERNACDARHGAAGEPSSLKALLTQSFPLARGVAYPYGLAKPMCVVYLVRPIECVDEIPKMIGNANRLGFYRVRD